MGRRAHLVSVGLGASGEEDVTYTTKHTDNSKLPAVSWQENIARHFILQTLKQRGSRAWGGGSVDRTSQPEETSLNLGDAAPGHHRNFHYFEDVGRGTCPMDSHKNEGLAKHDKGDKDYQ